MNNKNLIEKIFAKGREFGLVDMEVFISKNSDFNIRVFNKEIDNYSVSDGEGLSFRGVSNGKMGYSYTEKIDETSIDMLIEEAIGNAKVIDSDDEENIFEGSDKYEEVNCYNDELGNISAKEKIEFTKALEEESLKLDKRVVSVPYCVFGESSSEAILINTKGLDLEDKSNIAYGYISVMVKDGEDVKTGGSYVISNNFSTFDAKKVAKEVVEEALSMLGASSIKSNEYPIILRNDVSADILEAFVSIFSAENVQKDLSLLKDKIGKQIASQMISIIDDPFMKNGVASASFDGEGVATMYKKLIDKGVLKTYLHNTKTAKKDGVKSTGNAYKASYKSPVSIAPTNMYIEKGDTDLDDMIKSIDKGVLITNVQGLHSGLNPISGDFSLSAYGHEIEDGKVIRPINQITIAGNFYDMLKDIDMVGNDLKFILPGNIGSPSLKIKKLSVAGE